MQKDPSKGMKDQSIDSASYWSSLNHLPAKGVKNVVTDSIITLD